MGDKRDRVFCDDDIERVQHFGDDVALGGLNRDSVAPLGNSVEMDT
jgi:hypothetical protein